MIRVLVVDDSKIISHSLKAIIEQDEDIKVVGFGSNGIEAFNKCIALMPDVVLMDIKMPEVDGIDGVKIIKDKFGDKIKILMLTTFGNQSFIDKAIKAGADGYVIKDLNDKELIAAIKAVACGLMVLNQGLIKKHDHSNVSYQDIYAADYKKHELTWIEYMILKSIVEGKSSKEIACTIGISDGGVRNKISSLLSKFGVSDRTKLAIYALENDYI